MAQCSFVLLGYACVRFFVRAVRPCTGSLQLMMVKGVSAMCQGLTASYGGRVICRFFIGLFEAGFTSRNVARIGVL